MNASTTLPAPTAVPLSIVAVTHLYDGQVTWDGTTLEPPYDYEIFVWDGTETTQLSDNEITDAVPRIHDGQVAWFDLTQTDPHFLGHVHFFDGEQVHVLTSEPNCAHSPPYIRDGRVIFGCLNSASIWEVFLWEGGNVTQLPSHASTFDSVWLDDGGLAYIGEDETDQEVFLWNGEDVVQLTDNGWDDFSIRTDGGRIAWSGYKDGADAEIFLWEDGVIAQLTDNAEDDLLKGFDANHLLWTRIPLGAPSTVQAFVWDGSRATPVLNGNPTYVRNHGERVIWVDQGTDLRVGDVDPDAVRRLRFVSPTGLRWNPAVTCAPPAYDVIRGDVANLAAADDETALGEVVCLEADSADMTAVDVDVPPPGVAWFYLSRGTSHGDYGRSSDGKRRHPAGGGCL